MIYMEMNMKKFDKLFLLAVLVIGLAVTFSYGVYLDQNSEQTILFSNIKEYLLQFGAEDSALVQDMTAAGVTEISKSIERDHGIAAYYPASIVWFINQASPYAGSIFWHAYTFVLVFLGICALYFLCKELFQSTKIAGAVSLLFFFSPRMFAESHYNNKDMVLLSLTLILFYLGYRLMKDCSWKSVILFAIAGAFAFNVKLLGACFFGFIGLYALLYFICTKQFNRKLLAKMCTCILLWIGCFLLITPAAWTGLGEYVQYVFGHTVDFGRWSGYILFNGTLVHKDLTGIPTTYLPRLIVFTTPIGILVLAAAGGVLFIVSALKKHFQKLWLQEGYLLITFLTGLLPLAYAILAGTSVYNGWRHFYFSYAAIIMSAGYGVYSLNHLLREKLKPHLRLGSAAVYISLLALGILLNHPFEYCYYNPLAGKDVETRYEMDYWDLSLKQAFEAILADAGATEAILTSSYNRATTWGMEENQKALPAQDKARILVTEDWETADYLIINMTYSTMYNGEDYKYVQSSYQRIAQFTSYGNVVCEVYKK